MDMSGSPAARKSYKVRKNRKIGKRSAIDLKIAQDMLNAHKSAQDVAKAMGVKVPAIWRRIREGQLKKPAAPKPLPAAPAPLPVAKIAPAPVPAPAVAKMVVAPRLRAVQPPALLPPDYDDLPQGYVAGLIESKGKYAALEVWRAKYGTADRPISPAKALQEWHKYRGAR